MKKDIAEKWVAALRSGEYWQGEPSYLKDHNGGFCCLGVLCEIVSGKTEEGFIYKGDQYPDVELREKVGLKSHDGEFKKEHNYPAKSLALLNDGNSHFDRYSFSQLADIIEKEWEQL